MFIPSTLKELRDQHNKMLETLKNEVIPLILEKCNKKSSRMIDFIILYGSRARGNYDYTSDFDLLLCGDYFKKIRIIDRPEIVLESSNDLYIEPICYTKEDASFNLNNCNLTILDAFEEGIVLFKDGNYLDELITKFNHLKQSKKIIHTPDNQNYHWIIRSPI